MCLLVVAWHVHAALSVDRRGQPRRVPRPARRAARLVARLARRRSRDATCRPGHLARSCSRRAASGSSPIFATSRSRRRRARRRAATRAGLPVPRQRTPARFLARTRTDGRAITAASTCCSATATRLVYYSNRARAVRASLARGIYGLSNQWLDTPWPKLMRTRERFTALLPRQRDRRRGTLCAARRSNDAADAALPHAGLPEDWQRAVSAPFVVHERYGTRCSTVVLSIAIGRAVVHERRFDPAGVESGVSRLRIHDRLGRERRHGRRSRADRRNGPWRGPRSVARMTRGHARP